MMDDSSEYLSDSFKMELDNAVRKSWSELQGDKESPILRESPMGTPTNRSFQTSSSNSNLSSNRLESSSSKTTRESNDSSNAYDPVERHYSLTETINESITDIMLDLDVAASELNESAPSINRPVPARRSSIQDVQRVRQLLNPRSSFSGASSQEPQLLSIPRLCWVTILPDNKPELIAPIIVLGKSLAAVKSKYKLYVLHGNGINAKQLENYGLETLNYNGFLSEQLKKSLRPNSVLLLFIVLEKFFDLVCYLPPTSMVLENVDELLESNEISEEIDNDTCVLLSNELPNYHVKDEDIQILILRPSSEVAMCISEFFTVYGKDDDDRRGKVTSLSDCNVLKTLFDEAWSHLSPNEYSSMLGNDKDSEHRTYSKVVNFIRLKPWCYSETNTASGTLDPASIRLLHIWKSLYDSIEF